VFLPHVTAHRGRGWCPPQRGQLVSLHLVVLPFSMTRWSFSAFSSYFTKYFKSLKSFLGFLQFPDCSPVPIHCEWMGTHQVWATAVKNTYLSQALVPQLLNKSTGYSWKRQLVTVQGRILVSTASSYHSF
jgi:hypothetical protein